MGSKCTAKNKFVPQGQGDRPHQKKCTAKNKFVPRGPKTSIPLRRALQKINYYLEVNKIDYTKRRSPKRKSKSCLEVNEIDFTKRRTLQKINMPQGHQNRPQ